MLPDERVNRTVDGAARAPRAGSAAVLVVVAGVVLAAGLAGGDDGATPSRTDAPDTRLPRPTTREAPVFGGTDVVPPARSGQLRGLLVAGPGCSGSVALDLRTLRPASDPGGGCPVATSPSGRFTVMAEGSSLHVVDRAGPGDRVTLRARVDPEDAAPAVAVADDGTVATCAEGRTVLHREGRAGPSSPGCEPVALRSGLHWLSEPDAEGLPLVDVTGRARRFEARAIRDTGPPYRLSASPGGRFLGAVAFHPALSIHVLVVREADGHIVARRAVDPTLDPTEVRVSADGTAAAVLVSTDEAPERRAWFLLRLDRRAAPVRRIASTYLAEVAFAPHGEHMAVVTQPAGDVVVLSVATFGPVARVPIEGAAAPPRRLAWLP